MGRADLDESFRSCCHSRGREATDPLSDLGSRDPYELEAYLLRGTRKSVARKVSGNGRLMIPGQPHVCCFDYKSQVK